METLQRIVRPASSAKPIRTVSSVMASFRMTPRRYHDDPENESQASSVVGSDDDELPKHEVPWYKRGSSKPSAATVKVRELRMQSPEDLDNGRRSRRSALFRKLLIACAVLACFGIIVGISYMAFVGALIRRLDPPKVSNGLQDIVKSWKEPDANGAYEFEWRDDFSRDIVPKACHSHNDYWRTVPLYEALSAGCIGIEADVWLTDDSELLVSHSWRSTKKERTLRSLYLNPITNIFTHRNVSVASNETKDVGMFDTDPNVSTVLLIDFKSEGHKIWPVLLEQLRPLREKGWLTYYDGSKLVQGPLTVVGTGNTPFELVKANNTDRFVFFDAPLDDIANQEYTAENSYYASVRLSKAIGHIWMNKLSSGQINTLKSQISAATKKGLKSRYWDTPAWPISLRDRVWFALTDNEVGMLNVDDLVSATRWNWNWCIIAGLHLCGNS